MLAIEGLRTWFDTNTADHHHFYVEGRGEIIDLHEKQMEILNMPEPPAGFEVANVDIVIRLRPVTEN